MKIYTEEEIKKKLKIKNMILKILRIIFMPIIIFIVLLSVYIAYQKFYLKLDNVEFLGYKAYIVLTESMQGTIDRGNLIIVKQVPENKIKKDDIITFKVNESGATVTHRIINVEKQENGKLGYTTKGDNNNAQDQEIIYYDQIQGIVIKSFKKVGFIISEALTGLGLIIMIAIVILSYVFSSHKEDERIAREYARKKYNICKYEKD